ARSSQREGTLANRAPLTSSGNPSSRMLSDEPIVLLVGVRATAHGRRSGRSGKPLMSRFGAWKLCESTHGGPGGIRTHDSRIKRLIRGAVGRSETSRYRNRAASPIHS